MRSREPRGLFSKLKFFLIGLVGSLLLRAINRTLRWKIIGLPQGDADWACLEPRILAFWHSDQLMMPWTYLNFGPKRLRKPIAALISQHGDGRMISSGISFLGIETVSGSSSRGGLEALYEMMNRLKNGCHVGITPDGPRGPANRVKGGIIKLAQRSGAGIFPAAIAANSAWRFGSWDKMILPKPFSRAVLSFGEMIFVPAELSEEEFKDYTSQVECALNTASLRGNEELSRTNI